MFRSSYRPKRAPSDCKCDHPQITHYTKDGHCIFVGCGCETFRPKGRPEYQSKRARCELNHSHDSGLEIKVCFDFFCSQRAGEIKSFEFHRVLDLKGPSGATIGTYEIDFIVEHASGITEFVECKGDHLIREPAWRLKWALLQDEFKGNPKFQFRVIRG